MGKVEKRGGGNVGPQTGRPVRGLLQVMYNVIAMSWGGSSGKKNEDVESRVKAAKEESVTADFSKRALGRTP